MTYIFTVRRTRGDSFRDEPGATHFLKVPDAARDISVAHKIKKTDWIKEVVEAAKEGDDPNGDGILRGDIVIYVHGFNTPTKVMLDRTRKLQHGLAKEGFEGEVISFDWPCASTALNYLEDRTDAKETARRLVDEGIASFAAMQRPDCELNVHLIAHSMGSYVVREAFDDADDRPAIAARSWSVSQVMLVSGDVSASSMGWDNPKSSSLYRHCVRLTNYQNPFDVALKLSNVKRVGVAPRVGRVGLPEQVSRKAVNVDTGAYYEAMQDKFREISNPSHTWYFYDQTWMKDVYATIRGDVDRNRIETRSGDHNKLSLKV